MMRGWTLLILQVKGQGHNRHVWKYAVNPIYPQYNQPTNQPTNQPIQTKTVGCFIIKMGRHVNYGKPN